MAQIKSSRMAPLNLRKGSKMSTYNANMRAYDEARRRPLNLKSTRASKEDEDAHRDMDGFDVDEELARLRRAIKETETVAPGDNPALYRFIAEAFDNIDENHVRSGPIPRSWGLSKPNDRSTVEMAPKNGV